MIVASVTIAQHVEVVCPLCGTTLHPTNRTPNRKLSFRQHLHHKHYALTDREVSVLVSDVCGNSED